MNRYGPIRANNEPIIPVNILPLVYSTLNTRKKLRCQSSHFFLNPSPGGEGSEEVTKLKLF